MRYLVISDTHGRIDKAALLIERWHADIDGVLHLGDITSDARFLDNQYRFQYNLAFAYVPGNCDMGDPSPRTRVFHVEQRTVLMCHGDRYHVGDGLEYLRYKAHDAGADVVLFGHTHVPLSEERDGILFLNPGSLTLPRGGSSSSFAILELSKGKAAGVLLESESFIQ